MSHRAPSCKILFNNSPGYTHISQIIAGYKMLADRGMIRIEKAVPYRDFRADGNYEHSGIVEVSFKDAVIAYDLADGYQSIHRKDVFDRQMDRLDFYFKRSFDPAFHAQMRNKSKILPLGLNYLCTCKGNPYDRFYRNGKPTLSELRRFAAHVHVGDKNKFFYTQFESNERQYDSYNLLFLTRIWNAGGVNVQAMQKLYPYFSDAQAQEEAEKWRATQYLATKSRIEYVKALRAHFGKTVIAGIMKDDFSERICPDLIADPALTDRGRYLETVKQNFICITSEGLHHSIGWKFGEFVAAGKAIITEPLYYEVPFDFYENQNYLVYRDADSLIRQCEFLLNHVSEVHRMEAQNREYYRQHLRPDMLIYDTLKTAGIL